MKRGSLFYAHTTGVILIIAKQEAKVVPIALRIFYSSAGSVMTVSRNAPLAPSYIAPVLGSLRALVRTVSIGSPTIGGLGLSRMGLKRSRMLKEARYHTR